MCHQFQIMCSRKTIADNKGRHITCDLTEFNRVQKSITNRFYNMYETYIS